MGRLKGALVSRNALSVHYRKLVNEFGGSVEALSTTTNHTDSAVCCCHCGKPQLLQVKISFTFIIIHNITSKQHLFQY
jgi:hypothetical protein